MSNDGSLLFPWWMDGMIQEQGKRSREQLRLMADNDRLRVALTEAVSLIADGHHVPMASASERTKRWLGEAQDLLVRRDDNPPLRQG